MQPQPELPHAFQPEISRTFKLNIQQIQQTFRTISGVTDVLDDKICTILQKHQNQFFEVYRTHMLQIQKEIRELQQRLEEKERQLLELQDSGAIAKLTKRIKDLERELTIAFDKIVEKDKIISSTKLECELSSKEIEHLEEKLKDEMRSAVRMRLNGVDGRYMRSETSSIDLSRNVSGENLFATEIKTRASKPSVSKPQSRTQLANVNITGASITPSVQHSQAGKDPSDLIRQKLTAEVRKLTRTNQELLNSNVKAMSLHNQLQQFFISCIQQCKRLVASRTQQPLNKVKLAEFNREDKTNLLLLVLENDQIVSTIYSMLFKKNRTPRPSITNMDVGRVESKMKIRKESVRKNMSKKEYRSSEKAEKAQRHSSFELKLPTINETQKNNQVIARLLKKRQSVGYNDFL